MTSASPSSLPDAAIEEIFDTGKTFEDFSLKEPLLRAVEHQGYQHPTHVQAELIPIVLAGKDILGQSKTGTGKTAAFALPILEKVEEEPPFAALILTPTRELAIQVAHEFRHLGQYLDLKIAAVYGGQRIRNQLPKLQKEPQIVVGTPGRVMDFHRRGVLPYDNIRFAVLDEVDRMLDIGFRDDIRQILGAIRHEHQTIFVSATISAEIERLARQYLNDPEKLVLTAGSLTVAQVDQYSFSVEPWDKNRLLVHLLKHEAPALTLVFCRTKSTVDALTEYLKRKDIDAWAIHGDMYQGKRNRVMSKFRSGELKVLVASDLAARGLDVEGISHVINYDLPEDPEVYVHRIGRTARTGHKGVAWSFVAPGQGGMMDNIEKLTNVEIKAAEYADFQPGPVPKEILARREEEEEREQSVRVDQSRVPLAPPDPEEATDPIKFPGGVVPSALPAKRMGGRLRSRRR
ncbi:MAG: DEAD/DEAH box helicase [Planctomycetota bacterium]|nr:DEAD/DEAH box helicase [Planctomycetota bacterium]